MRYRLVTLVDLDAPLVLAPERYDPRRSQEGNTGPRLGDVVTVVRKTFSQKNVAKNDQFLVLDTSHASDGFIRTRNETVSASETGSAKKVIEPGDVIISRLRPYLRQVAFVDPGLLEAAPEVSAILCSTEFFVLRSQDGGSVAFLVPFLLSSGVQELLSASQEGGHHPRFSQATLESLALPQAVLRKRQALSRTVEACTKAFRDADVEMHSLSCATP